MATLRPRGGVEEAPALPNEPTIPTKRQARGGDGARGAAGSLGQDPARWRWPRPARREEQREERASMRDPSEGGEGSQGEAFFDPGPAAHGWVCTKTELEAGRVA